MQVALKTFYLPSPRPRAILISSFLVLSLSRRRVIEACVTINLSLTTPDSPNLHPPTIELLKSGATYVDFTGLRDVDL